MCAKIISFKIFNQLLLNDVYTVDNIMYNAVRYGRMLRLELDVHR